VTSFQMRALVLQQQDVKGIGEAREQAEQVADQRRRADLEAAAEQDRCAGESRGESQPFAA
jgi:hypothetical protein